MQSFLIFRVHSALFPLGYFGVMGTVVCSRIPLSVTFPPTGFLFQRFNFCSLPFRPSVIPFGPYQSLGFSSPFSVHWIFPRIPRSNENPFFKAFSSVPPGPTPILSLIGCFGGSRQSLPFDCVSGLFPLSVFSHTCPQKVLVAFIVFLPLVFFWFLGLGKPGSSPPPPSFSLVVKESQTAVVRPPGCYEFLYRLCFLRNFFFVAPPSSGLSEGKRSGRLFFFIAFPKGFLKNSLPCV